MKRWQCTVCGYIHEGAEPPEECPVCGADRSAFVELPAEAPAAPGEPPAPPTDSIRDAPRVEPATASATASPHKAYAVFLNLAFRYHFHPIAVHVPNGVVPISLLFVLLGAIFGNERLGVAAAYNTIFVALFMPVVLWSGYLHWKHRFMAARTRLFMTKIACGSGLQMLSLTAAIWYLVHPDIALHPSLLYVVLHLAMLALGGIAGYLGGHLVFNRPRA